MRMSWMPSAAAPRSTPSWLAPPAPAAETLAVVSVPAPRIEIEPAPAPAPIDCGHDEEIEGLRAALAEALARMASMRAEVVRAAEEDLVRLAMTIGERIAGESMKVETVARWAREGAEALAQQAPLVVRVSPEIAEALAKEACGAEVRADPALPKWGCVVEGSDARASVGFSARVRAMQSALGLEEEP